MFDWWRKVRALLRRDEIDAELEEELIVHREMKATDAGKEAIPCRAFGTELLLDDCRDAWRWPRLEGRVRDLRHGFRGMAKRPGFSATVILTLAIGIGTTSTIFSLVSPFSCSVPSTKKISPPPPAATSCPSFTRHSRRLLRQCAEAAR